MGRPKSDRPPGRPKGSGKPPDQQRRPRIWARCTPAEWAAIEAAADAAGLPTATWIRTELLRAAQPDSSSSPPDEEPVRSADTDPVSAARLAQLSPRAD